MPRTFLVPFVICVAVAATVATAPAASLPSGTISCQFERDDVFGLRFVPHIDATPGGRIVAKATLVGTCDSSAVSGGRAPIERIEAKLLAKIEPGTVCSDIVTAPHFGQVKLSLKWRGAVADRLRTIATSKTHLVLGSWDDSTESLVFTGEIFKGAFAGSTTTVRLAIEPSSAAFLTPTCPQIEGIYYSGDGGSSIAVP